MGVLKHFVEECAGSVHLRGIEKFWSMRIFWLKNDIFKFKKVFWIILTFHAQFFNHNVLIFQNFPVPLNSILLRGDLTLQLGKFESNPKSSLIKLMFLIFNVYKMFITIILHTCFPGFSSGFLIVLWCRTLTWGRRLRTSTYIHFS